MSWSPTLFRKVVALVAAFGVIAVPARPDQRSYSCLPFSGTRRQDPYRSPSSRSTECGNQPTRTVQLLLQPGWQAPKNQPRCQSLAASKGCYWLGCCNSPTYSRRRAKSSTAGSRSARSRCVEAPRRRQVDAGGVIQAPPVPLKLARRRRHQRRRRRQH